MSLTYKIMWIDDTPEWVESISSAIEDMLQDEGFQYQSVYYDRPPDLPDILPDPELSLIAVDWNLQGTKGDEVIKQIRKLERYREVLFYSADGIHAIKGDTKLDGVYYRERNDVEDSLREIVENHIERTINLNTMRGIIVSEAIKIENNLADIMANYLGGRKKFYLEKIVKGDNSPYDFAKKHVFVKRALDDMRDKAFQADDNKMCQKIDAIKSILKTLPDDIIHYRNIFAHGDWERSGDGEIVLKGINKRLESVSVTRDKCRAIRKNYLSHLDNLHDLAKILDEHHELWTVT